MIPVLSPRIIWLAFVLTLFGVIGTIVAMVALSASTDALTATVTSVVGASSWVAGGLGAGLTVRLALSGARMRALVVAVIVTVGGLLWFVAMLLILSMQSFALVQNAMLDDGPGIDLAPVCLALAVTATVLCVTFACASRQLNTGNRFRRGAAVLVASIPFLNLAIFVERNPPLPDITPREHR